MTRHPALRRWLGGALVAAALLFLARAIWRDADRLAAFEWEVRPVRLAASVVVLSAVLCWGVVVWRALLLRCGARVPFRPLARAWFLANLSRYIPGVVWQFVSLAHLGPSLGMGAGAAVTSLLLQMGFLLLAAGAVGVLLLPAALAGPLAGALPALRWLTPLVVLAVHPAVVRGGLATFTRITRRAAVEWRGSWLDGAFMLALSAVSWLLYGATLHLFLSALVPLPLSALPAVTAMNALAFIVGYLAFFAPGGLGFKEGALTVLLAGLVPPGVAAALALATRLWTIAGEVGPAAFLAVRGGTAPLAAPRAD